MSRTTYPPAALRDIQLELYRREFQRFGREQLKIRTDTPGEILPFVLNGGQQILDAKIEKQIKERGFIRAVLMKGRQLGGSTYSEARIFHKAALTSNYSTLLIAYDQDGTQRIFDMAKMFHEELSPQIRPMIRYSTRKELVYENPELGKRHVDDPGLRSRMDFQHSGNMMAGTSSTRHALHISEVAKWIPEAVDDLKSSFLPTIHKKPGTILIYESTAYATGDHFRQMVEEARSGKSLFIFVFVPWWLDPKNALALLPGERIVLDREEEHLQVLAERGQLDIEVPPHTITPEQFNWRREEMKPTNLGDRFPQEHPSDPDSAFISLSPYVFDRARISELRTQCCDPLRMVEISPDGKLVKVRTGGRAWRDENYLCIWEDPRDDAQYDIGVDVGGDHIGNDWSVAEVFRREDHSQVAEYHIHKDATDLGSDLYWLGKYYNNAQLIVEMNGIGLNTHQKLAQLCYPYLYMWRHREKLVHSLSTFVGWKTQRDSKRIMVGTAKNIISHRRATIRSKVLWDEMFRYVFIDDDHYRCEGNWKDDAVTATMICWQGAEDESMGVPPPPPPDSRVEKPMSAAYQDDRDLKVPKVGDAVAREVMRELQGE